MAVRVGVKGQVVITKEIRDRLGVQPGWLAIQRVVDDHVEIRFFPPDRGRSLAGVLAPYTNVQVPLRDAWSEARERAWVDAAKDRYGGDTATSQE